MAKRSKNLEELEKSTCNCGCNHEDCKCDENCECEHEECNCGENCECDKNSDKHECHCHECDCEEHVENDCREEEFKEILQRVQAEFENYRRRTESSMDRVKEDGVIHAINKLLPVLDSFKSAKALVKDEEFLKSLELIEKQFIDGLNALNITKIDAENQEFNPSLHNAVLTGSDAEKPEDTILEVYQDGYKLKDRVIRYSVVKINKVL
ncbi:MAG: nucleotide exchange factor GrpE [Clostridiales bacterium]|nr:nucleotide exchange factor GrpE [Clostridiales bacterium]